VLRNWYGAMADDFMLDKLLPDRDDNNVTVGLGWYTPRFCSRR